MDPGWLFKMEARQLLQIETIQVYEMGVAQLFEMEDGKFLNGNWTVV